MQTITPEQHFILSYKTDFVRFTKPGEAQDKAIKRLMSGHKRAWSKDPRTGENFPRWTPTMTTREYVRRFQELNKLIDEGHTLAAPDTFATLPVGPELTVEIENESMAANDTHALALA